MLLQIKTKTKTKTKNYQLCNYINVPDVICYDDDNDDNWEEVLHLREEEIAYILSLILSLSLSLSLSRSRYIIHTLHTHANVWNTNLIREFLNPSGAHPCAVLYNV